MPRKAIGSTQSEKKKGISSCLLGGNGTVEGEEAVRQVNTREQKFLVPHLFKTL